MRAFRTTMVCCISLILFLPFLGTGILSVWADPNEWTSIGPDGGGVNALAMDPQSPSTIYAVASGGIFKSTDGGESWKTLSAPSSGRPFSTLNALAIDPLNRGTVYAGSGSGVFKTTDGGASWSSPQMNFPVGYLAIDPRNPGSVFAGSNFGGLFKTTDGGTTWSAASSGLEPPIAIYGVAIDPQNPGTVYAGTNDGLFKSTDGGTNWSATGNPFVVYSVAIDPQDPSTLYANDSARGLFKSTDGGVSWRAAGSGLLHNFAISVAIDPQNAGIVYAGTGMGVFKTTNGGTNWSPSNAGLPATLVRTLAIDPQNPATVYVVSGSELPFGLINGGVFKSTNGGTSWSSSNSGLAATSVSALAIDPQEPDTIYAGVAGALFKRTDGRTGWANTGLLANDVSSLAIDPQDSNTLYVATLSGGGVFKSMDHGASWNAVNSGLPALNSGQPALTEAHAVAIDPQDTNTLYVGTFTPFQGAAGAYKSTDGGANWSAVGSGLPTTWFAVASFAIDPQSAGTVYAVMYDEWDDPPDHDAGIYKSSDRGASWVAVNVGLPTEPYGSPDVSALTIDPKNPATLYAGTYKGVFKSTNGGASWSAANSGLAESITSLAIDPLNPNTIYAGTWESGVFKSKDAGSSWSAVNFGLTTLSVRSLVIDPKDPNRLYAGTNGGGTFAITFVPDLVVTELRLDRTSVVAGGSFAVTMSGPNLTRQTFFDLRFTSPGTNDSAVSLNWQRGLAASHDVPIGTFPGRWTISGVRAHEIETDHTGGFVLVSGTITVSP